VAPHDFYFALEFSSQGAPASLVEELAAQVFRYVGASMDAVTGLDEAFEQAAAAEPSAGQRRCDVQFRARDGMLEILVTSNGGRIWQHAVVIP
jgi:hypothetical protein